MLDLFKPLYSNVTFFTLANSIILGFSPRHLSVTTYIYSPVALSLNSETYPIFLYCLSSQDHLFHIYYIQILLYSFFENHYIYSLFNLSNSLSNLLEYPPPPLVRFPSIPFTRVFLIYNSLSLLI